MLAHEKLHVYGKALAFVTAASAFSAAWSKRHAVKVAAYLDLVVQKLTLGRQECGPGKALLGRIVAMLSRM